MIDILTWMWHDPLLEGSRGSRARHVGVPQLRQDLVQLEARRRKKALAKGIYLPTPVPQSRPEVLPTAPRSFKMSHVIQLAKRIKEVLPIPHRFVCIVDDPAEVCIESSGVHWMQTPEAARKAGEMRSPEGNRFPSCYRRLWAQSEEAASLLSEWVLLLDIDLTPIQDWSRLIRPDIPFIGWRPYRDWGKRLRIGGGIYGFKPGANTDVWNDFIKDPRAAVLAASNAGFRGSDQAWLSYKLAHKVPLYGRGDGIYSIRDLGHDHRLPADARLVQFNGPQKPWSYHGPAEWVAKNWLGG